MKLKYLFGICLFFTKRRFYMGVTNTSLCTSTYLSFSSQWERLQHDEGEAGQLKGNLQLTTYAQRLAR